MAEVPGTSSETITETVSTSTPPPPQQVHRLHTLHSSGDSIDKIIELNCVKCLFHLFNETIVLALRHRPIIRFFRTGILTRLGLWYWFIQEGFSCCSVKTCHVPWIHTRRRYTENTKIKMLAFNQYVSPCSYIKGGQKPHYQTAEEKDREEGGVVQRHGGQRTPRQKVFKMWVVRSPSLLMQWR